MNSASDKPVKRTQVKDQLNFLDKETSELYENIGRLEEMLEIVTLQEMPTPVNENTENAPAPPGPALVTLAVVIAQHKNTVSKVNTRLNSLFDRLEL